MAKTIRAQWSTTYLSYGGYEVTLTFSGEDMEEVMTQGHELLIKMKRRGVVPVRTRPEFPKPHRSVG